MPPSIAAVVCFLFIGYLYWDELRQPDRRRISWAPFVWMFLGGSRFASYWVNLGSPVTPRAYDEGSPVDRAVFLALIVWGAVTLARREINWGRLLADNKLIVIYLLYALSSLFWTDEPFILAKRWVKDLGSPIMALVMLTERQPYEAVGTTLKRLAFLMLPLSVLFTKYYPELGRGYTPSGAPMYTGVGNQKNDLGLICLMTGMYFAWKFMRRPSEWTALDTPKRLAMLVLIGSLVWLLYMSDSQTSTACLIVAVGVLLFAKIPQIASKPTRIIPVVAIAALVYAVLQASVGINEHVLALMGRDATLTNRTSVWELSLRQAGSPVVGTGFMSFWNPERSMAIAQGLDAPALNQAHNGYLEQYLNLGYIGVGFIFLLMLATLISVRRHLEQDGHPALLRLCFLITAILYNYTEASFYGVNNMWVLLLTASIQTSGAVRSVMPALDLEAAAEPSGERLRRGRLRVSRSGRNNPGSSGV